MNNALETTIPAALTGTPKQIAFAAKIRQGWIEAQLKQIAAELKIVAGNAVAGADLIEGVDPKCEELRDGFVAIVDRRVNGLRALVSSRSSAKAWIESLEGQWVLKHGSMARK
jgi:hypothetical protein